MKETRRQVYLVDLRPFLITSTLQKPAAFSNTEGNVVTTGVDYLRKLVIGLAVLLSSSAAQAGSWTGKASYYHAHGAMTCAHRSLPFGTHLRVTNLANHHSAVLTVADRGPFIRGRVVDVSTQAAGVLGFRHAGVVPVRIETMYE